jgi:hypothetical protein
MKTFKLTIIFIIIASSIISCSNDDDNNEIDTIAESPRLPTVLDGSIFKRTSYIIETPMDGNGDGIYNTDLMLEVSCFPPELVFDADGTTFPGPDYDFYLNTVNQDDPNAPFQVLRCRHADGILLNWDLTENILTYSSTFNQIIRLYPNTGELSSDGNTLTFVYDEGHSFWSWDVLNWGILNPDQSISPMTGKLTLIYTRI